MARTHAAERNWPERLEMAFIDRPRPRRLRVAHEAGAESGRGAAAARLGDRLAAMSSLRACLAVLMAMALFLSGAEAREAPDSFADLAERVLPAVVNISTTQTLQPDQIPEIPQLPPGSPFEEFFKEFFERQQRPDAPPRRATSLGSGFVIDPDGYIVTNYHVIKDADEILVRFHDESSLAATLIGRDPKTDVALLKVEPKEPLPFLKLGDSSKARVGDWVIAIGNPFGLGGTVTAGIISARQRDINAGPYDDFIQSDASINRGNSGGPLVSIDGEVIGINTAIFSPSGGSVGIGFAIPSSLADPVIHQLREFGETRRGWLGVRIQTVTDEIAESLGLDNARGALVASVTPDGPAEKAGIEAGDIILSFDGKPVEKMRRLPRIVAETRIGAVVPVEVWRKGETRTFEVEVEQLAEEEDAAQATTTPSEPTGDAEVAALGLKIAELTDEIRQKYDIGPEAKGVVVTEVAADGPAQEKGLLPGDIVVEVNQDPVEVVSQVAEKVEAAVAEGRKSVLLLLERKGDLRFVAVGIRQG